LFNNYIFIITILILITCQSCINEPDDFVPLPDCPEIYSLGQFSMEESSLECFPFEEDMQRIIFSDEAGNEFAAEVEQANFGFNTLTNLTEEPCPEDENQTVQFSQQVESRSFTLFIESLDMRILLTMRANVLRKEQLVFGDTTGLDDFLLTDGINFTIIHPATTFTVNSQMSIIVNTRNHPFASIPLSESSVEINGVTFTDVFSDTLGNIASDDFDLHYTKTEGIVGIVRKDGTSSLKFERVE